MEEKEIKRHKRAYAFLIFTTFFMYVVLTGAKNLYVAEKTTLQTLGSFGSYTDLAATMEYYFYAYAVMQILLVFFIKKLNIKWFLTVTLGVSAVITILVAFTDTIVSHWVLYTVNGAMQAGIWGCSIKMLGKYLPERNLSTANKLMTSGPAVAGVVSYATAAAFGNNWKLPFIILGITLLVAVTLYFLAVTNVHRFPRIVETHHVIHADGTEEDVSDE
ncbi:MAG: MFS transporter [Clostridia bacterium]|nr:MFS transporter [Clostridia bacterium]